MKQAGRKNISFSNVLKRDSWSSLSGRLERVLELWPLTRLGAMIALVALMGLWYLGFSQHDLVWYVGTLSALALIVLALSSVFLGSIFINKSMQRLVTNVSQTDAYSLDSSPLGYRKNELEELF